MSEGLVTVEQPLQRPPGVTARQWRLAVIYPNCQSAFEACVKAGYKPSGAAASARQYLVSTGTQLAMRTIQATAEAQRDKAKDIKAKAAKRVCKEVDSDNVDPNYALNAWATASKIAAEYPEEEQRTTDAELELSRAYIRNVVRSVLVAAGALELASGLTDASIDSIAHRVSKGEAVLPPLTALAP